MEPRGPHEVYLSAKQDKDGAWLVGGYFYPSPEEAAAVWGVYPNVKRVLVIKVKFPE